MTQTITSSFFTFLAISAVTVGYVPRANASDLGEKNEPPPANVGKKIGNLSPSFYWVALEQDSNEERTVDLLDINGGLLLRVTPSFFKQLKMEGTGKLVDGRIINFHTRVDTPNGKEIRWRICPADAPFGYGLEDRKLEAFKSVAVDPTVVPMGSKLYIPAARGAELPDGTIHNGVFNAVDVGDAIKNRRIDVFTSYGDQSRVFDQIGFTHGKEVEVFLVE